MTKFCAGTVHRGMAPMPTMASSAGAAPCRLWRCRTAQWNLPRSCLTKLAGRRFTQLPAKDQLGATMKRKSVARKLLTRVRKFRDALPADIQFNRLEANARGKRPR